MTLRGPGRDVPIGRRVARSQRRTWPSRRGGDEAASVRTDVHRRDEARVGRERCAQRAPAVRGEQAQAAVGAAADEQAPVVGERGRDGVTAVDRQARETPPGTDVEDVDGPAHERDGDDPAVRRDGDVPVGRAVEPDQTAERTPAATVPHAQRRVEARRHDPAPGRGGHWREDDVAMPAQARPEPSRARVDDGKEAVEPRHNDAAGREGGRVDLGRAARDRQRAPLEARRVDQAHAAALVGHERAAVGADRRRGEEVAPRPDAEARGERTPETPGAAEVPGDDAAVEARGVQRATADCRPSP